MNTVPFYLALGSNIGERERYLQQALNRLIDQPQVRLVKWSALYQTEPVGPVEQPLFLNMVVEGETSLTAEQLLDTGLEVERELGRQRNVHWGPRTIDIDILLYDQLSLKTERLELPHPRLTERAFVLVPLAEIAPDVTIPGHGLTVRNALQKVSRKGVERWMKSFIFGVDGYVHFAN